MVQVRYRVTGFGEFFDVKENPTEKLVERLRAYTPTDFAIDSLHVLETSAEAVRNYWDEGPNAIDSSEELARENSVVVHLHLGVHARATGFNLETIARNWCRFRGPDQKGAVLNDVKVVEGAEEKLKGKIGVYDVVKDFNEAQSAASRELHALPSTDCGGFVCNYAFFLSCHKTALRSAEFSIFLHIPSFEKFPEEVQYESLLSLMGIIAKKLSGLYGKSNVTYDPATAADLEAILPLFSAFRLSLTDARRAQKDAERFAAEEKKFLQARLKSTESVTILATETGEGGRRAIVGYCSCRVSPDVMWLHKAAVLTDLFVVPAARHRGIGTRLLERLHHAARERKCAVLDLQSGGAGPTVAAMLEKLGKGLTSTPYYSLPLDVPAKGAE